MSSSSLRVTLAQINTTVGDLSGNLQKIADTIKLAQQQNSQLVVFPELTVTGYPPEDLLLQKKFITDNISVLERAALHADEIAVVAGFVDRDRSGNLYNAACLLQNKKIRHIFHKHELPNYSVFDEKRYFRPGIEDGLFELNGVPIGLTICEDIWEKKSFVYRKSYRGRASLLINISASPYYAGKLRERQKLITTLAKKLRTHVLYLNLIGGQDELVFDGGSMVADKNGALLCQLKCFNEDIRTITIEFSKKNQPLRTAYTASPGISSEVYQALILGTRDYIQKNRFEKVLVGLSGGVDSALVARIAVDALGADNVVGVTMPSPYSSKETYNDAKLLAKNLNIKCLEFNISNIFSAYNKTLAPVFLNLAKDTTEENLQARIRGNLLMALSNKHGYLVLTTGNKSEMATGYCTLYGDMAGGFAVLKDVPKTLVFKLARYRNTLEPKNSIPASTIKRPPTAELRLNQKDQDTLPPYAILDRFLERYVENDIAVEEIVKLGLPKAMAIKTARMVEVNEYKRRQSPPGIKITPKAFGRDRRMPITNRYVR